MTESTALVTALVLILITAVLAMREASRVTPLPGRHRRPRRRERVIDPVAVPLPPEPRGLPPMIAPVEEPANREWLLDALPVEPAGPRPDRAAGAGRLLIGITGMAIAGAVAILGISRGLSALFDRLLR